MMTLLRTKLTLPFLPPRLVPRPHLIARLNQGLAPGCRLVLVSAPAGYGKTTLVAQWLRQTGGTVAWLSLDEDDNDPARLLSYLIGALQSVCPSLGQGLEGALRSPQTPPVEELLAVVVNQLVGMGAESPTPSVFLVLDDVQALVSPVATRVLERLLAHLPAAVRLVMMTRADPLLPLARLRGRGQLVEVRQADLRFESGEAAILLSQTLETDLAAEDVAVLTARTEGWVAGLQMAAIGLQRPAWGGTARMTADFIAGFSGSSAYIVDYLGDEVLDRQAPQVRQFLLWTSILERLSAPLCAAVAVDAEVGTPEAYRSHHILSDLAQNNLFVIPLDAARQWYRYHHLFRDLLRQRLAVQYPDLVPRLHRRASIWYERAALAPGGRLREVWLMGDAIKHAMAAQDAGFLADLLERHAEALLVAGEIGTVLKGFVNLSADAVRDRPGLCLFQALGHVVTGRLGAAADALSVVAAMLEGGDEEQASASQGALPGMLAAMRATVAYLRGEGEAVIGFAQEALERLPQGHSLWRGSAAMTLGDAHTLQGDLAAAAEAYASSVRESQVANNAFLRLIVQLKLADTIRGMGQLRGAVESCRQLQALSDGLGLGATARGGSILVPWGEVLREWNRLDEARDHLERAVALADAENHVPVLAWALPALIHVHFSRGDLDAMEAAMARLDQIVQLAEAPVWGAHRLAAWRARLWVARKTPGYPQAAVDLLNSRGLFNGDTAPDAYPYLQEEEYLACARWYIAAGHPQAAVTLLAGIRASALTGGRRGREIEAWVLEALAWASMEREDHALSAVEEALRLAAPAGYLRVFVDEGTPMARLLLRSIEWAREPGREPDTATERQELTAYAKHLLALFPVEAPPSDGAVAVNVELVEPLSDRELEVLQVLATGATNQEIAQQLVIAPNTVKKHVSNIIGKLAVDNRRDAVHRARTLGLIP